ncbi:aldolase/citrate lyase family protein [Desulfocastanea catecholica]
MKPYRSILSVPGHIQKMHTKIAESAADVIMLGLEDSVPQEAKEGARMQVLTSLQTIDWQKKTVSIRINGLDTAYAYWNLLAIVEGVGISLTLTQRDDAATLRPG